MSVSRRVLRAIRADGSVAAFLLAMCVGCENAGAIASPPSSVSTDTTTLAPRPSTPVALEAVSPQEIAAPSIAPQTAVSETPTVRVLDQYGQPMAGVVVTFAPYSDSKPGGSVAATLVKSDSSGHASCGQWIVGATEGSNWLYASIAGGHRVAFHALVLLPDPPGARYDLQSREERPLLAGEAGHLVLADDGTFRLVWLWALGTPAVYVAVNTGTYRRLNDSLAFFSANLGTWALGELKGEQLVFSYDDYLDIGFHSIVVETYMRQRTLSSVSAATGRGSGQGTHHPAPAGAGVRTSSTNNEDGQRRRRSVTGRT